MEVSRALRAPWGPLPYAVATEDITPLKGLQGPPLQGVIGAIEFKDLYIYIYMYIQGLASSHSRSSMEN